MGVERGIGMTSKEYLAQVKTINIGLKYMLRQAKSMQDTLTDISQHLSDTPGSPTRNIHRMEQMIAAKVDLETKIEAETIRLAAITRTINAVSNPLHAAILTARYISGLDWRRISGELSISRSRLYQHHREALAEVERLINRTFD
jgi:DNA-directed RNA polymerase specialized sigma subunit